MDQLSDFQESPMAPGLEEQFGYFYGLPSRPKLVARSGAAKWRPGNGGTIWPIKKILSPASWEHKAVSLWGGPLREDIISNLDGINWMAIDILQVGLEKHPERDDDDELVHTLLISVVSDSTTWEQGFRVVMACWRTFQQYGIHDIQCEMKESHVLFSASAIAPPWAPKLISQSECAPDDHPNIDHRAMITEGLGSSIAASDTPTQEGSKGIYLKRKDNGEILSLTCRHVLFSISSPNVAYRHGLDAPAQTVIQPGSQSLKSMVSSAQEIINWEQGRIDEWRNSHTITEEQRETRISHSQNILNTHIPWKNDLKSLAIIETRIFGHILFSPDYSIGLSPSGRTRLRDWALIELHSHKHRSQLCELKNAVGLHGSDPLSLWSAVKQDTPEFKPSLMKTSGTQILEGIVSEEEIKNPRTRDQNDKPIMLVAKYGRSSYLTIGVSNPIQSVRRTVFGQVHLISEEWCILGRRKTHGLSRFHFSELGDSGSCVWDMEGRIAGIITGGNGTSQNEVHDVTYATPIEWLLHDISNEFGAEVDLA